LVDALDVGQGEGRDSLIAQCAAMIVTEFKLPGERRGFADRLPALEALPGLPGLADGPGLSQASLEQLAPGCFALPDLGLLARLGQSLGLACPNGLP
jgi:hypothetical protein